MKFIIKTTGITDRLSVLVSSPQSGRCGLTVGTARPFPAGRRLKRRGHWRLERRGESIVYHLTDQSPVLMKYHDIIWKIISKKWCWLMLISTLRLESLNLWKRISWSRTGLLLYSRYLVRIYFPLGIIQVDVIVLTRRLLGLIRGLFCPFIL